MVKLIKVLTQPFNDQEPGTSGLRKPTKVFLQANYTENFIQATLDTCVNPYLDDFSTVMTGGDGRYYVKECLKKVIIPMCLANGVKKLIVGLNGLLSTPCASYMIRSNQCIGGILLTASHNPGGIENDFGIKFNCKNGGPAPEKVTEKIFSATKALTEYKTIDEPLVIDLSVPGITDLAIDDKKMRIEIVDTTKSYSQFLQSIFDFTKIKRLFENSFKCRISGLNGVMGPYINQIFCQDLGMDPSMAINCDPLEDFGGHHPDPNLTYARSLVEMIEKDSSISFGAAFDGDGDRNMILGKNGYFVCPCDLLALIANNLDCIKYFENKNVVGMARSMPTSRALDEVCKAKGYQCYETPTGWKYFGNLMDEGLCSVCGEESFGHGSDHIREKDGIWAVLAILSLLAKHYVTSGNFIELEELTLTHWNIYGRHFFTRYDYENISVQHGKEIMTKLGDFIVNSTNIKRKFGSVSIDKMDDFSYTDPTDKSISSKKGIRIFLDNGVRLVYRLSGTGSNGATLRVYIDQHEKDKSLFTKKSQEYLKKTIDIAKEICGVTQITGRNEPTVIT